MHSPLCGLSFVSKGNLDGYSKAVYLPLIDIKAHSTVLSTTTRTLLSQTFVNSSGDVIPQARYTFPLHDGACVVGFTCRIGNRVIQGSVKEREKARADFHEAVKRGQTVGLLERLPSTADVFTTTVGNLPPRVNVAIGITYLQELKHDMEAGETRLTFPTAIAPRYGKYPFELLSSPESTDAQASGGFEIIVDIQMAGDSFIRGISSPSHPIAVSMGTLSSSPNEDPSLHKAAVTLSLGKTELESDFVLQVRTEQAGKPRALLERHPTIADSQALMITMVPNFTLPSSRPEIVFLIDRSGSMHDKIATVISAMQVFLKSLPVGLKFNICSFGTRHSFLWPRSKSYSQTTLKEATAYVQQFSADHGGTNILDPVQATVENRYADMELEVMLLTDGEIWDQSQLFAYLNKRVVDDKAPIRVFTLGIGDTVSHSLIEGVARAGNGFSQAVITGERLDNKIVRMLKGALTPHVTDYGLEVRYEQDSCLGEEYEIIDKVSDSLSVSLRLDSTPTAPEQSDQEPISLYDPSADVGMPEAGVGPEAKRDDNDGQARFAHLPQITVPKIIQSPAVVPSLFSFIRQTVYLLMCGESARKHPKAVVLRGTSSHGPLELEIPVQILEHPSETIHQLAAKKAVTELEEGRGWIFNAKDESKTLLRNKFPGRFDDMVEREAVRLGIQFQVGGRWCSFVATEEGADEHSRQIHSIEDDVWTTRAPRPGTRGGGGRGGSLSTSPRNLVPTMQQQAIVQQHLTMQHQSIMQQPLMQGQPMMQQQQQVMRQSPMMAQYASSPVFAQRFCDAPLPPRGGFGSRGSMSSRKKARTGAEPRAEHNGTLGFGAYNPLVDQEPDGLSQRADAGVRDRVEIEESALQKLTALQNFDGSWDWTDALFEVVDVDDTRTRDATRAGKWPNTVLATALAVVYFEQKLAEEKATWELMVEKARGWLESECSADDVQKALQEAIKLLLK